MVTPVRLRPVALRTDDRWDLNRFRQLETGALFSYPSGQIFPLYFPYHDHIIPSALVTSIGSGGDLLCCSFVLGHSVTLWSKLRAAATTPNSFRWRYSNHRRRGTSCKFQTNARAAYVSCIRGFTKCNTRLSKNGDFKAAFPSMRASSSYLSSYSMSDCAAFSRLSGPHHNYNFKA
jgi:hypothetical protein